MIRQACLAALVVLGAVTISACGQHVHGDEARTFSCTLRSAAEQGFSGFSGSGALMSPVGRVANEKAAFEIYFYEFINPESEHGNHRLVIFSDKCKYFGSYAVYNKPVGVEKDQVVFPDTGTPGTVAKFDEASPPDRIWIDGDLPTLER